MAETTLSGDFQTGVWGDYVLMNNTWGRGDLINGTDFTQTVTYDPADPSAPVVFDWSYPATDGNWVMGFPSIKGGWRPWDNTGTQDIQSQVRDVRDFTLTFDTDLVADPLKANVSINIWLTSTPFGSSETITTEILLTLHEPNYFGGPDSPRFYDPFSGYAGRWFRDVNQHSPTQDIVFIGVQAEQDFLDGTLDLNLLLKDLVRAGAISGTDYLTGFEFGSEMFGGAPGSLTINAFDHDFSGYRVTELADLLQGTFRSDDIAGRGGADQLRGMAGHDFLRGGMGADRLWGGAGRDVLSGGAHRDTLWGGAGDDSLLGGAGRDSLYGDAGADHLDGGDGADLLTGGTGDDLLTGGDGADLFLFGPGATGPGSRDRITDFVRGQDKIDLGALATLATGGDGTVHWRGGAVFSGNGQAEARSVSTADGVELQADANGDGVVDIRILLAGVTAIGTADLLLV